MYLKSFSVSDADAIALALAARPMTIGKSDPRPGPRFEDQLRHAQENGRARQITGGIAHDFNNLLLAINFNLESLAEEVPESTTPAALRGRAQRSSRRIASSATFWPSRGASR